ncbi:unnamed protein product [Amoebophrya sp. A120]|nr:unnamed protein product [Amoebophrya sp. A120]|eukprot:GSA120T00008798001.1
MEVEQFISTTQQQSGDNDKNLAKSKSDHDSSTLNNYNDFYMTSPGDTFRSFEDAKSAADFSKEKLESCLSQVVDDEEDDAINVNNPGGGAAGAASQASTGQLPKTKQVEVIRRLFKYPDFNLLDAKYETSVLQQPNTSLKVEVITDTRISTRPFSTCSYGMMSSRSTLHQPVGQHQPYQQLATRTHLPGKQSQSSSTAAYCEAAGGCSSSTGRRKTSMSGNSSSCGS